VCPASARLYLIWINQPRRPGDPPQPDLVSRHASGASPDRRTALPQRATAFGERLAERADRANYLYRY